MLAAADTLLLLLRNGGIIRAQNQLPRGQAVVVECKRPRRAKSKKGKQQKKSGMDWARTRSDALRQLRCDRWLTPLLAPSRRARASPWTRRWPARVICRRRCTRRPSA